MRGGGISLNNAAIYGLSHDHIWQLAVNQTNSIQLTNINSSKYHTTFIEHRIQDDYHIMAS